MCLACLRPACDDLAACAAADAAAPAVTVVRDFTALLAGPDVRWNALGALGTPAFVTYSFTETPDLPALADYNPYGATGYAALTAAQRDTVRTATALITAAFGVAFIETAGEAMIEVFASSGASFSGWANYPFAGEFGHSSGRLVMNRADAFPPGTSGFQILLHEFGHALGLKHPFERDLRLAADLDNTANTLMSYTWSPGGPRTAFGPLDIAALSHLYGPASALAGMGWSLADGVFRVTGSAAGDAINGLRGVNHLSGGAGNDTIHGAGNGADTVLGGGGRDRLFGHAGNDALRGGAGNDTLDGGAGADTLRGGGGNDRLAGDAGHWGNDVLYGDAGDDTLSGGEGQDRLFGGSGDDRLGGDGGFDTLEGGTGDDTLSGDEGVDSLYGGGGNDRLDGGGSSDQIFGGAGNDTLTGGEGFDALTGGAGRDVLTGGPDADFFHFGPDARSATDRITDFVPGLDRIMVEGLPLGHGDLAVSMSRAGDALLRIGGGEGLSIRLVGVAPEAFLAGDVFFLA